MQSVRIKSTAAGQADVGHALNRVVASNLHRFSCYDVVARNVVASNMQHFSFYIASFYQ